MDEFYWMKIPGTQVVSSPHTIMQSSAVTRELKAGKPPSWPGLQTCASAAARAHAPSSIVPWKLPPTAANRKFATNAF